MTPFSDLHYFSTQQLVRVIPFKKNRPGCSCPLNKTLHSVFISPRSKAKNVECHRWSAIILGEAYTLLRIVAWNTFPFDVYTVYIFISFISFLKCLLIWEALMASNILLIQFYLFSCIASWHIFSAFLLSTFHKNISSSRAENISALSTVIYLNTAQQCMNERLNKWMECKLGSAEQGYWAFYKESVWELHLYTLKRLKCLD